MLVNFDHIPRDENDLVSLDDIPLPDTEERIRKFEIALDQEILAELGTGTQGACFLLENQKVFKVTDSEAEALLAAHLIDHPHILFPEISSVHQMEDEYGPFYAIIREEVGDVFDEMNDDDGSKNRICYTAWPYLGGGYDLGEDAVFALAIKKCPEEVEKLSNVYAAVKAYSDETGINVTDLVFSNVGRADDDRFVIRDFGRNNILETEHAKRAEANIQDIVTPTLSPT